MAKNQIPPARPQQNPPQVAPQPRLRPASQDEVKAARAKGEIRDFGNMEFGMELQASGSFDPVSKLGFMQDRGNKAYTQGVDQVFSEDTALLWRGDEIAVGSNRNTPAVWNHEYRHKGFKLVEDRFRNLTNDEIQKRWGFDHASSFDFFTSKEREEEDFIEMFDNPEHAASPSGDLTMADTVDNQFLTQYTEQREKMVEVMSDLALDMLKEQGSPDPAKRKEAEGFFKSLLNSFFGGTN